MKRAALYVRVSTDEQSTENQMPSLVEYCKFRDWTIVDTFADEGISGSTATRPALEKMMDGVRSGKYDVVLVWSYDRFARSVLHLVNTLDLLQSLRVDFISYRERIDTTTPEGRMMFQFYAVLAEFERSRMAARTKATLARLKAQGKRLGRPLIGNPEDVKRLEELRSSGHSLRSIAAVVGHSKSWVASKLKRPQNG